MRLYNMKKTCFLALLICCALILAFFLHDSMKNTFEFDPDEGTNLIKAQLVREGFDLYKQIWSDQPPLFTALLSSWFRMFGSSVYSARLMVLFFSWILLWGLYQNIRIRTDPLTALTACIFLILSADFLRLSISVMIGIPSLALALAALYCAAEYSRSGRKTILFLSAGFMACALLTKFFTVFMLPLILMEITPLKNRDKKTSGRILLPGILWLSGVTLTYFLVILAYFYPQMGLFFNQLFKPHLARVEIPQADFSVIFRSMIQDYDIALLAIFGIAANLRVKKNRGILLPGLWLGMAFLFLALHRPVWDHYYLLISIPVCWLAAILFAESLRKTKTEKNKGLFYYTAFALIVLAAAMMPFKLIDGCSLLKRSGMSGENRILDLIAKLNGKERWIFTDLPIYAFRSGILVPPETAVLTSKRLPTAELVEQVFKKYKPGLILLGRFKDYAPQTTARILADYRTAAKLQVQKPILNTLCFWRPIAAFLPGDMRILDDKRINRLLWNTKIPAVKRWLYHYAQDAVFYIRKDAVKESR